MSMFASMARNNAWANARLYGVLNGDVWGRELPSFFGSIRATMQHIHEVDLFYLDALVGGGLGRRIYFETVLPQGLEAMAELQGAQDRQLIGYCECGPDAGAEVMTERREGMVAERVGPLLLHLFQHQVHHRGQVHGLMSAAGLEPPQLDDFHLEHDRHPSTEPFL